MKKQLIYAGAALALATAVLIPTNYASAFENEKVPHIDGKSQFPFTRWALVRHTFQVHIPKNCQGVDQLSIEVPTNVTWSKNTDNIDVVDDKGRKINTNVSVNGKTILIAFTEPVSSNTKLEIDLKNVKQPPLSGNSSIYRLFAKCVDSDAEIFIGLAQFRTN